MDTLFGEKQKPAEQTRVYLMILKEGDKCICWPLSFCCTRIENNYYDGEMHSILLTCLILEKDERTWYLIFSEKERKKVLMCFL